MKPTPGKNGNPPTRIHDAVADAAASPTPEQVQAINAAREAQQAAMAREIMRQRRENLAGIILNGMANSLNAKLFPRLAVRASVRLADMMMAELTKPPYVAK